MSQIKQLPTPSAEAIAHSQTLLTHIQTDYDSNSKMPFSEFMAKALYTPGLGYYSNDLAKIGRAGDFITAPEISPLFSRCLARQAKQVLATLEQPNIVEFGAGLGTMAKDILLELDALNQPVENYYIVELSAGLKQVQQETLSCLPQAIFNKIQWLDQLPSQPINAVVLANEVLDAMPVERLKLTDSEPQQAWVKFDNLTGQPTWHYQPIQNEPLQSICQNLLATTGIPSPEGYETEVNLNIAPWLESINDFLSAGAVLLIDYGYVRQEYYQPARVMGTLRCHYQHLAHSDPFFYPGLQDITAHVDFTAVAEAGFNAGFEIAGFTTQAHFLMGAGLLDMASELSLEDNDAVHLAQQIKTLTLPDEMGESFKCIALTKQIDQPLIGFQLRDLCHQL